MTENEGVNEGTIEGVTSNENVPNQPIVLTKNEVEEKIRFYWKEVETTEGFNKYKESWDKLNYYRDLKLKLYK
jgi:hypothetical protein